MPFYYDMNVQGATANASANVETDHIRTVTAASQPTASVFVGFIATAHQGTAVGAIRYRLRQFGTASTVGTALTPVRRHPDAPAARLVAATLPTAGTTATQRLSIGGSVLGGTAGWAALERDHGIAITTNAAPANNLDMFSICQIASAAFDYTLEFLEG